MDTLLLEYLAMLYHYLSETVYVCSEAENEYEIY